MSMEKASDFASPGNIVQDAQSKLSPIVCPMAVSPCLVRISVVLVPKMFSSGLDGLLETTSTNSRKENTAAFGRLSQPYAVQDLADSK